MFKKMMISFLTVGMLCGCYENTSAKENTEEIIEKTEKVSTNVSVEYDAEDAIETYEESQATLLHLNELSEKDTILGVQISENTIQITKPGTYVFDGSWQGIVVVDSTVKGTVRIVLNQATLTSTNGPAIVVEEADKVILTSYQNTENQIVVSGENEDGKKSAIYSKDDLVVNGSGLLTITSKDGDGIQANDDLTIVHANIVMEVEDDGIVAHDTLGVVDSSLEIVCNGDGLKAGNSDGTADGNIVLEGNEIQITSGDDGVNADGSIVVVDGTYQVVAGSGAGEFQQNEFMDEFPPTMDGNFQNGPMQGGMNGPKGAMGQNKKLMMPGDMQGGKGNPSMNQDGMEMMPPQEGEEKTLPNDTSTKTTSENTSSTKGIKAKGEIEILGGTLDIDASDDAIHSDFDVTISGGTITIHSGDDGIHSDETLTFLGGIVNIEQSYEGIEAYHIVIEDGEVHIVSSDDGLNASDPDIKGSMMSDTSTFTMSGGLVTIDASGDGVDLNGKGTMSGGTIIVYGPTNQGNGALDYNDSFVVTGGTVLAGGSSGMAESVSNGSSVGAIMIGTNKSSQVTILDESGNEVLSYESAKNFTNLMVASELLEDGKTYTIYQEGEKLGTVTIQHGQTSSCNVTQPQMHWK